jgi:hypothetical protein
VLALASVIPLALELELLLVLAFVVSLARVSEMKWEPVLGILVQETEIVLALVPELALALLQERRLADLTVNLSVDLLVMMFQPVLG